MSNLDGIAFYGEYSLEDQVVKNTISFLNYGLIELGAYYNIEIDQLDINGNNESVLTRLTHPSGISQSIYVGHKGDWIWETGITAKSSGLVSPVVPTGILIDDVFHVTGSTYEGSAWYIDFDRGRIVFEDDLSKAVVVKCPHSLRYVQVYTKDSYQYRKVDSQWFASSGSVQDLEARAYLPAIFVDMNSYRTISGLHLGSRAKVVNADMEFGIVTGNPRDRRILQDTLYMLETKLFRFYDLNTITFPLNQRGELVNQSANWLSLVENFPLSPTQGGRFAENARIIKDQNTTMPLYKSRFNISMELNVFPA